MDHDGAVSTLRHNPTDIDGFMEDLMRVATKSLREEGIELIDMGMGFYDDSKIIGVEKPMVLIFGNVSCERMGVASKQFQYPLEIDKIKKGEFSVPFIAGNIVATLKEEFVSGRATA